MLAKLKLKSNLINYMNITSKRKNFIINIFDCYQFSIHFYLLLFLFYNLLILIIILILLSLIINKLFKLQALSLILA